MGRRNPILTFALSTSLLVHGLALASLAWWFIDHTPPPKLAAIDRTQFLLETQPPNPPAPVIKKTTPPPVPPKKKSPPPKPQFEKPQQMLKDDSGEHQGTGTANRSTDGAHPMQANQGYEQADLMRDSDKFADDSLLPSSKGEITGNNAPPQKSPKAGTYTPDFATEMKAINDAKTDTVAMANPTKSPGPSPLSVASKTAAPAPSGTKDPVKNVPVAQLPTPKPVKQEVRGRHATASDTESMAFSKAPSLPFVAGKVVGRPGLKVKSKLPNWGLASGQDIETLGGVNVVVGVVVDADGNVLDAQILQSSGSANIDQDLINCIYSDWTLEPQKDKSGQVTDDHWVININESL